MALAELVSRPYEMGPSSDAHVQRARSYPSDLTNERTGKVFDLYSGGPLYRIADLELKRMALQSKRPVKVVHNAKSNRPSIERWISLSVDGLLLTSVTIVAIAFFIFLLEVSAGRPAFVFPSFSAFFIFSIICLVTLRLRKKMQFIQSDELSA